VPVSGHPRGRSSVEDVPKVGLGLVEVAPPVVNEVQVLPLDRGVSDVAQLQDRRAGQGGEQRGVGSAQDLATVAGEAVQHPDQRQAGGERQRGLGFVPCHVQ